MNGVAGRDPPEVTAQGYKLHRAEAQREAWWHQHNSDL